MGIKSFAFVGVMLAFNQSTMAAHTIIGSCTAVVANEGRVYRSNIQVTGSFNQITSYCNRFGFYFSKAASSPEGFVNLVVNGQSFNAVLKTQGKMIPNAGLMNSPE